MEESGRQYPMPDVSIKKYTILKPRHHYNHHPRADMCTIGQERTPTNIIAVPDMYRYSLEVILTADSLHRGCERVSSNWFNIYLSG